MVIVVGTGAGGATVAKELSKKDIKVTIIEKGPFIETKDSFKFYNKAYENVDMLYTSCVGGTTVVSAGNAVKSLENELKEFDIDISSELNETQKELGVHTLNKSHVGEGTEKIIDASKKLNLTHDLMPKFTYEDKCNPCGLCSFGCPNNAKWTAIEYIKEAIQYGANLICENEVINLIVEENKICGVEIKNTKTNEISILKDDLVILSAGAIGTTTLLQKIGIDAGKELFMDTFITVGGVLKGINFKKEVQMNLLIESDNFILSPHYSTILYDNLKDKKELKDLNIEKKDIIGLMVKISDENKGYIKDNKIFKENTLKDLEYLAEGAMLACAILTKIGVDPITFTSTNPRGAHPGGTAAIGKIVDENLKTNIEGLFVSDASVLPTAPGKPPILTIIALSKRLSKHLINKKLV